MSSPTGGAMVDVVSISHDEANRILAMQEGHYLDFKHRDLKPAKLSISISSFANTSGGEVFLGVAEVATGGAIAHRWEGFDEPEKANDHIQVLESIGSLNNHYRAEFLKCEGMPGLVLHVLIPKTKDILKATDDTPYVRRNAQNLKVDTEESLRRLRLDKGIVTFEDETLSIPLDVVTNSVTVIDFLLSVVPSGEPETWLRSQFLIEKDKPTVAGTLLFAEQPQAALPKRSGIKIYRYKSKEAEGSRETLAFDPITIEGSLYGLIDSSVKETKRLIEGMKKLGVGGLEDVIYPDETLHEVVTNAVLHRDYSISSDVHIRIYDNRIEVESPGKLPGHVTTANILYQRPSRLTYVRPIAHSD